MDQNQPPAFCRDCLSEAKAETRRCSRCHGPRIVSHPELNELSIAHVDCDCFYAAIEKRDRPELADKPVIVGGGVRGVVSTACYVARIKGVKSAMPMFKALKLCPEAVVIKPDIKKYAEAGRAVRALMERLTPLVEPLSIDEAFLDLSGTVRLHGRSPALSLAGLLRDIEQQLGFTASAGLSYNKYLAKLASDLEKPRGYSVIGRSEARAFLAALPVRAIWGVGEAFRQTLERDGITSIGQLQIMERNDLIRRYGSMGTRLYHLSRGQDIRSVVPDEERKSIGAETTFNTDISDVKQLETILWSLTERVSRRAKADNQGGETVTLKLKTSDFKLRTRTQSLKEATQMAHAIFAVVQPMLLREARGERFRLIGVSLSHLNDSAPAEEGAQLDTRYQALTQAELAMDKLQRRFGSTAIGKGRGLRKTTPKVE